MLRARIGVLLGLALLAWGCHERSATEAEPQPATLDLAVFDSLFTHFSPEYNYNDEPTRLLGHVSRVTVSGKEQWQASFGTADTLGSATVGRYSLFRIGSATKMFTATVVLQLWEEGRINLDAPFNLYLSLDPEDYPTVTEFDGVTVRHLLSHRSGLPRISSTTFFETHDYTDAITQLERMKFLFTDGHPEFGPGTGYGYRNSNFNVLGLVIEQVAGAPLNEVFRQRILSPLGLEHTGLLDYDISPRDGRLAHGYFRAFDGIDYHGSQAWAAGGMVSSVPDLSTFMRALVTGQLFQQQTTLTLMESPEPGSPYGLGMFITHTTQGTSYGHGGAIFGYNTHIEYFPSADAVIAANLTFDGIDFQAVNWLDDFCLPIVAEIRRAALQSMAPQPAPAADKSVAPAAGTAPTPAESS